MSSFQLCFVGGSLASLGLANFAYFAGTKFQKEVQVKEKYTRVEQGRHRYMVTDNDGNIYRTGPCLWRVHWTQAELWNSLEKDKTYHIKAYGWRVPFLNIYPNITNASLK